MKTRKPTSRGWVTWAALAAMMLLATAAWAVAVRPTAAQGPTPVGAAAAPLPTADGQVPEIPSKSLLEIIKAGGILMIPIFFCSVLTLVIVFERTIALRRGRVIPGPFVKRFLPHLREGKLDRQKALALCEESHSPVSEVFAGAVRKWGRPAVEVEQGILDAGERAVNGLRRYVRVFNGVSTITPLLGLQGTVFGMIHAFNSIAASDAMGRPERLAGGISEALITTAAGLTVAIPSLACYLFFTSRVDQLVIEIDAHAQEIVHLISAEAIEENGSPTRSSRSRKEAA